MTWKMLRFYCKCWWSLDNDENDLEFEDENDTCDEDKTKDRVQNSDTEQECSTSESGQESSNKEIDKYFIRKDKKLNWHTM